MLCHDYACLQHWWFQLLVLTCLCHVRYLRSIRHYPVQCVKDNSLEQAPLFTCFTRDHYDKRLMSTWVLHSHPYNSCCLHFYKINPVSISSMSKMARLEKLILTTMLGHLRPYLVIKTPLDVKPKTQFWWEPYASFELACFVLLVWLKTVPTPRLLSI